MIYYQSKNKDGKAICILHFGIGLIGNSLKSHFLNNTIFKNVESLELKFDWNNELDYTKTINYLFVKEHENLKMAYKIFIIWSAGNIGFQSNYQEAENQFNNFVNINKLISNCLKDINGSHKFILFSSAGGLFEGQIAVNKNSLPKPLRPYGFIKLREELFIRENSIYSEIEIYRISSVYSTSALKNRKGLMQTLMENGMAQKITHIFGYETTLRDYVLDSDIAVFLVKSIFTNINNCKINFLVNSKPSSIYEIRKEIEKVLGKKIYILYSGHKSNSLDISFSSSLIPNGFICKDHFSNLKLLRQNLNY